MKTVYTFIAFLLVVGAANAQTSKQELVMKYDQSFDGIGPIVYVLPTKEEILTHKYVKKSMFSTQISKLRDLQELQHIFEITDTIHPNRHLSFEEIKLLIDEYSLENKTKITAILHTEIGKYLLQNKVDHSIQLLTKSLEYLTDKNIVDNEIFQRNLAELFLYNGDYKKADSLLNILLQKSITKKNTIDQADYWVKIAVAKANQKNFDDAENYIIRKAIPLYNRAKQFEKKIQAWNILAKVYQLNHRFTEAQWFLIQARDLASTQKITQDLAEIEYLLAFSKLEQKNFKVAAKEFENALSIVKQRKDLLLELAIHDKLGETYLHLKRFDEAEKELIRYHILRTELWKE